MKYRITGGILVVVVAIILIGCGGGGGGKGGGANSPEELFDKIKETNVAKMSDLVEFVAPDERSLLALMMDFAASFTLAFGGDESLAEDYLKIREKYKLPGEDEEQPSVDLQDIEAVQVHADKLYGDIDIAGFIGDVENFLEKIPGSESSETVKWTEIKDLKISGDTATATVLVEGGDPQTVTFRKIDGKWYFSQKAQLME